MLAFHSPGDIQDTGPQKGISTRKEDRSGTGLLTRKIEIKTWGASNFRNPIGAGHPR